MLDYLPVEEMIMGLGERYAEALGCDYSLVQWTSSAGLKFRWPTLGQSLTRPGSRPRGDKHRGKLRQ